ncbi:MAG TPA: NADH-quinone oxidoreductase subunit J [Candidatus Kapabacteria bacterium]|nr:NADH-quinone oxidoreductase subunit J [Candidatus Kapabacteria bacterium]
MNIELILFVVLGLLAVVSALMVVSRKSPIAATMFLVMHFMALGGLYLLLHAQFMAVVQVLVYAGAIMVLVVFVIMLLNLGDEQSLSEKVTKRETSGIALSMLLGGALIFAVTRAVRPHASDAAAAALNNGTIESVGKALFTTYVFPFEMISLVLLAAAVGAVVLTKRHLV